MPTGPQPAPAASIEEVARFVVRAALMAHQYGTPSYALESLLPNLTEALGYRGAFMAQPRNLAFTFWDPADPQPMSSAFVDLPPVTYDMNKLNRVTGTIQAVAAGTVPIAAATTALDKITAQPPLYPPAVQAGAFALAASGFAVLLNASWPDVAISALLSIGVWAVTVRAGRTQWLSPRPHRVELVAAFLAACAAHLIAVALPGSNPATTALCSFIVLIPGLPLTLGVLELTEGHTLAGLNRLMDGTVSTFSLFAGAAVGSLLCGAVLDIAPADPVTDKPAAVSWLFVVVLMLGLTVVLRVVPRHLTRCSLGGLLAYAGVTVGGQLGTWQGPFLGAVALGMYASVLALATRVVTPLAVALPGVLVLVPGAAAYLTLSSFQPDDPLRSLTAVTGILTQIVAIVAGLSTSTLFLPTRSLTTPADR